MLPLALESTDPRPDCRWAQPETLTGCNCQQAALGGFVTPSMLVFAVGTGPLQAVSPRGRPPGSVPVRRRHSGSRWAPRSSQLGHSQPHRPTKGSYDRSASASSAGIGFGLLECTAASCTAVHSNVCNGFFSRSVEKEFFIISYLKKMYYLILFFFLVKHRYINSHLSK